MEVAFLLLASVLLVFLVNIGTRILQTWRFRRAINKIPGPKALPFFGNALTILRTRIEDRAKWFMNVAYGFEGGIVRIWLANEAVIHIRKPRQMEVILSSSVEIQKSTLYDFIKCWLGEGLVTSTGAKWHRDRKMITPSFHFGILEGFSEIMYEKAEILNECLEKEIKGSPGKPVDIFAFSVRCTMDVICETAMGTNLNSQREIYNDYGQALHRFAVISIQRAMKPWLKWDWIFHKTASGKEHLAALETMHNYSINVIRKKQEERKVKSNNVDDFEDDSVMGRKKRKAFLDLLLDASENEKTPLSEQELREHVDTFMFAGHDTTATAISWGLFIIGHHPEIQQKIHDELDEVCGGPEYALDLKDLPKLKYLEMAMKEVLRLYPSAPIVSRKMINDFEMDGYLIPKGANVSIGILLLHHDPEVWSDPEKFDPERFSPERSKNRHPYAYLPFSAGPRNCIGQKFAMIEFKIILATVLRKWRVKSVRAVEDQKMALELILRPHEGIPVYLEPR